MSTTRFHWGWRIGIVYTVFALGTLGFVVFAMTQEVDLVRSDYYEYSLDHDSRMSARQHADALGAALSVAVSGTNIVVSLPVEQVGQARGTVALYRASSTHHDREVPLALDAEGTMKIPTTGMEQGKWTVTTKWTTAGQQFERVSDIEIP
jgi:nitrogen fixation protein FixH